MRRVAIIASPQLLATLARKIQLCNRQRRRGLATHVAANYPFPGEKLTKRAATFERQLLLIAGLATRCAARRWQACNV
jgi:hypothetical protein